jgi:superfamily I DNA/RNA helicase
VLAYLAPSAGERANNWNPFWTPGEDGKLWTYDELNRWLALIKTKGILKHGAKAKLEKETGDYPILTNHLLSYFELEALQTAQGLDLGFLQQNVLAAKADALNFPLRVVERLGQTALQEEPKIILGTIHSVKGGEADVVYLFPDLSRAGYEEWSKPGDTQDGIRRLMYVGMTRTKDVLALCSPASPMAVRF